MTATLVNLTGDGDIAIERTYPDHSVQMLVLTPAEAVEVANRISDLLTETGVADLEDAARRGG